MCYTRKMEGEGRDVRLLGDGWILERAREQRVQTATAISEPGGKSPVFPVSVAMTAKRKWMGQQLTLKTMCLKMSRNTKTSGGGAPLAGVGAQHRDQPDAAGKSVAKNPHSRHS